MSEVIVIVAVAKNNIIGNKGDIPWHIKEDFQHFKELTLGHPCIMGDKTYESLPEKPLPGRENIVLTFDKNYHPDGAVIKHSFEDALEYCKDKLKVYICGGATIYKLGMKVADKLEITRIHKDFKGDTLFPDINLEEWKIIKKEDRVDEKHGEYSFITYKRKNKKEM